MFQVHEGRWTDFELIKDSTIVVNSPNLCETSVDIDAVLWMQRACAALWVHFGVISRFFSILFSTMFPHRGCFWLTCFKPPQTTRVFCWKATAVQLMSRKPRSSWCRNLDVFLSCLWSDVRLRPINAAFYPHSFVCVSASSVTDVRPLRWPTGSGDDKHPGNISPMTVITQMTWTLAQPWSRARWCVSFHCALVTCV